MLNNYNIALRRYKSLQRQLSKDPNLEKLYAKEMEKLIENRDVEEIDETPVQAADSDRYVNYIPHLCVARFDKVSSQVRPVFDASAKNNQGVSLNENLVAGPKTQKTYHI